MTNRFTFAQGLSYDLPKSTALAVGLLLAAVSSQAMAQADDDPDGPATVSRPVVQSTAPSPSRELNAALARLAADPRNATALFDAADAALRMGDSDAAIGFLTRANEVQPGNARAHMLMGKAYLAAENPVDAVRAFDEAERAGGDPAVMAADRGLAYDLVGDNARAQRWYQVALAKGTDDDVTRRYAMSLAISGDRRGAEALLAPLIQRQDRATWRTRTFVMAVTGGPDEAVAIAYASMPQELASGIAPYLRYMPRLTPSQQAAAANFGRFPRAADIGRDDPRVVQYAALNPRLPRAAEAGLIPAGTPLGTTTASAKATQTASREKRRRPGKGDEKVVVRQAVARPVPAASAPTTLASASSTAAPSTTYAASAPARAANVPVVPTPAPAPLPAPTAQRPTVLSVLDVPPGAARPAFSPPGARPAITPAPTPAPTPTPTTTFAPSPGTAAMTKVAGASPASSVSAPAPAPAPPGAALASAQPTAGFDLAKVGGSTAGVTASTPVATAPLAAAASGSAATPPAPVAAPAVPPLQVATTVPESTAPPERPADFAAMFKSFTPPAEEQQTRTAAVDITRLPAKPDPRGERPDAPTDVSRTAAKDVAVKEPAKPATKDARSGKDAKPAAKDPKVAAKEAKDAKAKKAAPSHPSRIWVQVLTGANKGVMDNEWRRLTKEAPELRTRKPYLSPWRSNYRLLTGPFESEAAAQDFIGKLRKSGVSSYQWTSPAGQAVDSLSLK